MIVLLVEKVLELLFNINGDEFLVWVIKLLINGGFVNYGLWVDRYCVEFQCIFVFSFCKDVVLILYFVFGVYCVLMQFKFYFEFEDIINICIFVREELKNWRWKGKELDFNNNICVNDICKFCV